MGAADTLVAFGFDRPAEVPAARRQARAAIDRAVGALAAIPDDALTRKWRWRGEPGSADVRYGFYRLFELLEEATNRVGALGMPRTTAARILGQATAARWDYRGLARQWSRPAFDRDPGGGEWTLRQTLGHVVSTQASYTVRTIYAVHRHRHDRSRPVTAEDDRYRRLSIDEAGAGSLADVLARFDDWLDVGIGWLVQVDDLAELAAATTWAGYDVDAHFRLHRWAPHVREHAVQVEKTLGRLGHYPREVDRLVRLVLGAYGWLEAACLGLEDEEPGAVLRDAAAMVEGLVGEIAGA